MKNILILTADMGRRLGHPRAAFAVARLVWAAAVRGPQPVAMPFSAKRA